jgi:hypothetical protein
MTQMLICVKEGNTYHYSIEYCGLTQHDNQIFHKVREGQKKDS